MPKKSAISCFLSRRCSCLRPLLLPVLLLSAAPLAAAQTSSTDVDTRTAPEPVIGVRPAPFTAQPYLFDTAEQHGIQVEILVRGLRNPFSLVFLPDGDALVVERRRALRLVRSATSARPQLAAAPVAGLPHFPEVEGAGLQDVALHPDFARNRLVYFTYNRPADVETKAGRPRLSFVLAQARYQGNTLSGLKELVVGEPIAESSGSRIIFDGHGHIFVTTGAAHTDLAKNLDNIYGKVLRVDEDGGIPSDNPFVRTKGARGEIFSYGHRDQLGIAIIGEGGNVLTVEHGPNGGDKVNHILPGRNYGWPYFSFGRNYDGSAWGAGPVGPAIEPPIVLWNPSVAPMDMAIYTADRFPAWKGNLFVASARRGQIDRSGGLERIVFNDSLGEIRRESLLGSLHRRVHAVRQGPDGLIYALLAGDDLEKVDDTALARISPAALSEQPD